MVVPIMLLSSDMHEAGAHIDYFVTQSLIEHHHFIMFHECDIKKNHIVMSNDNMVNDN